jgi:hypothetical protein
MTFFDNIYNISYKQYFHRSLLIDTPSLIQEEGRPTGKGEKEGTGVKTI